MKSEKSKITEKLSIIKKYGWEFRNLQNYRANGTGTRGLTDYILFNRAWGVTIWAELKLGPDKLNAKQCEFQELIDRETYRRVRTYYMIITEKNIMEKIKDILEGKYYN